MSLNKTAAALAAIPLTLGLLAQSAVADPPHGRGLGHDKHDREGNVAIIVPAAPVIVQPQPVYAPRVPVLYRAGPPPWAPAHGYRRKGQPVYAAPYGIAAGSCYREQGVSGDEERESAARRYARAGRHLVSEQLSQARALCGSRFDRDDASGR